MNNFTTTHWGLFAIVICCGIFKKTLSSTLTPKISVNSWPNVIYNWSIMNILNVVKDFTAMTGDF